MVNNCNVQCIIYNGFVLQINFRVTNLCIILISRSSTSFPVPVYVPSTERRSLFRFFLLFLVLLFGLFLFGKERYLYYETSSCKMWL